MTDAVSTRRPTFRPTFGGCCQSAKSSQGAIAGIGKRNRVRQQRAQRVTFARAAFLQPPARRVYPPRRDGLSRDTQRCEVADGFTPPYHYPSGTPPRSCSSPGHSWFPRSGGCVLEEIVQVNDIGRSLVVVRGLRGLGVKVIAEWLL